MSEPGSAITTGSAPARLSALGLRAGLVRALGAGLDDPAAALVRARLDLPLWAPGALGTGIGAWFAAPADPPAGVIWGLGALAVVALLIWARGAEPLRFPAAVLALMAMGGLLAEARAGAVAAPVLPFRYDGPVEGRVLAVDRSSRDRIRLTLDAVQLADMNAARSPAKLRVTLRPETRALDLVFTGDRATGVETAAGRVTARRGVILAAGAFETPRLLTLAGIGPEAELARLGLGCRVRAEGVGQNLQDHPLLRALNFRLTEPFGPMQGNGGGTLTIWKSDASLPEADLLAFPIQGRSGVPALIEHYRLPDQGPLFAIGLGVMRSWSRGRLRLTGTGVDDPLDIRPGLLTDPRDLAAMKRGVEALLDMVTGPAFAGLFAGFAAPEGRLAGDALDSFVRRGCSTFFHCCGTARMGEADDAPVTPRLAVRGTRGLWVADASVIPVIPACHTHAPVTLIGERAATFILEDA